MNTLDFEERMSEELLDNPALKKAETDMEFAESANDGKESDDWGDDFNDSQNYDVDEILRQSGRLS